MPFNIIRNDITRVSADAIVNTANPEATYAGGTDAAIYAAAGADRLLAERKKIGRIAPGGAAVTSAFDLPAKYIIHTVGPAWIDGNHGEYDTLRSCYKKSLALADSLGCRSVAFPLISTGVYGFPKDRALDIALKAIREHLENSELDVTLVVFERESYQLAAGLSSRVEAYIDENYVSKQTKREYFGELGSLNRLRARERLSEERVSPGAAGESARGMNLIRRVRNIGKRRGQDVPKPPETPDGFYEPTTAADKAESAPGAEVEISYTDDSGHHTVWRELPPGRPLTIGRASDRDLVLVNTAVSRRHATLLYDGLGGLLIEDTLSHRGVLVNGEPVTGRVRLRPGDVVNLAGCELTFRLTDEPRESFGEMPDALETGFFAGTEREESGAMPVCAPAGGEAAPAMPKRSLDDVISNLSESFRQRLFRMIDERGLADPDVYKRANIDRKLFSKIRVSEEYIPKKKTVEALAIALRLDIDDAKDLLASAGYALANNNKSDVIISFCLENRIYDIYEVNALLFKFDQPVLS